MHEIGTRLQCFGKSLHAGHTGHLVADYGDMLFIKSDEVKYSNAFKSSGREGLYFQVDSLLVREIKEEINE